MDRKEKGHEEQGLEKNGFARGLKTMSQEAVVPPIQRPASAV